MFRNYIKTKLGVVVVMLALPAMVSALCLSTDDATDPADNGFATQVQADQGQGSIDCTAFIGRGGPMHQIPVWQDKTIGTVTTPPGPINWKVTDPDINANVDVVFVGNSDGSRCTQFYSGNARSGFAAAGEKTNKDSLLIACSDDFSEPAPPPAPVPPITTTDNCSSDPNTEAFQLAINNNPNYDWVILGGRNTESGAEGNTAICVDEGNGNGKMTRCVERCITPAADATVPWYAPGTPEYDANCLGDGPFFPIECRACELNSVVASDLFDPDTQFCWEQAQKATLGSAHFPNGSFKLPPGEQGEQGWTVKGRNGSQCYLISGATQSGYRYSYWAPSGCPK